MNKTLLSFIFVGLILAISSTTAHAALCGYSRPGTGLNCAANETCVKTCEQVPGSGSGQCEYSCQKNGGGSGYQCAIPYSCPAGTVPDWTNTTSGCVPWDSNGGKVCGNAIRKPGGNASCDYLCAYEDCYKKNGYWHCDSGISRPCKFQSAEYASCIRTEMPVTGYVWEDTNGNGSMGPSGVPAGGSSTYDTYWAQSAIKTGTTQCAKNVSGTLDIRGQGNNTSATWACTGSVGNSTVRAAYTTPYFTAAASRQFTLTPPSTVNCASVTWDYKVCRNSGCTSTYTGSGSGCTATITNYSGSYANTLNWRLGTTTPRTISGSVYQITDENTCAKTGELGLSGLSVQAYNDSVVVGDSASVSSSNGAYTLSGLDSTSTFNSVCISGNLSSGDTAYSLACVTGSGVTCQTGSGACAVSCTPSSALTTGDATVSLGFLPLSNDKWFSVLDGDLYADAVSAAVASTPAGGFSSYLINTQTSGTVGGYGFAANTIDTQTSGTDVAEEGGAAERLSTLPNYPFEDEWLNKFSFEAPTDAQTSIPSSNDFEAGTVYNVSVSDINTVLARGSYSIDGDSPSAAVVYVTGSGTIDIPDNFTSDNDDSTLVLITAADVTISEDAGTTTASYSVTGASQLDLILISQADINLVSQYSEGSSTYDNPLMVYGSLVSNGSLNLDRNLGAADNSSYPATTVRFNPFLLNLIQQYEIDGTQTGLATVDVQFDYGE